MTSSRRCFAFVFASVVACSSFAGSAFAQRTAQDIETARQLYNQGIELRDKGDLKGALDKFRAAHALGNTPLTGIDLCRTYAALHMPVEAREVCLGVARIPPMAQETTRSQDARTEAGKIAEQERPKIGALRIKLQGVPPGKEALVLIDGAAIPAAALTEPRAVNPGSHAITAKVGSGPETKATVETKEGESKDLALTVQAPADEPPPKEGEPLQTTKPPEKESKSAFPLIAFVTAGVAVTIGSVAGLVAIGKKNDLETSCIDKKCGRELHDDLDSAEHWGNASTAFFILGGVALGAGLVSMMVSSHSSPAATSTKPHLGLGRMGLDGTF